MVGKSYLCFQVNISNLEPETSFGNLCLRDFPQSLYENARV